MRCKDPAVQAAKVSARRRRAEGPDGQSVGAPVRGAPAQCLVLNGRVSSKPLNARPPGIFAEQTF